jgi:SPP1 family predicted phage head-tail adaptor
MTKPSIGELRHRITLEAPVRTSDGAGGAFETWAPVAEFFAAMHARTGSEAVVHDRISGRISHEFWIRPRADVAPSLRFRLGDRLFHIHAVLVGDDRGRRLRCLCEERDL